MSTSAITHSVHVADISPSTTETHLHDFFTFCGKITSIDFHGQTATIHFEKPSAAKTALMLNGGTLDGAHLAVTSDTEHADEPHSAETHTDGSPLDQSDKPRAGIASELLAKGYTLSDQILQRAIEIDSKQGISQRFLAYIQSLDKTVGAKALGPDQTISGKVTAAVAGGVQQAKTVDEQQGFSKTAASYYSKAFSSPLGQKVRAFYTTTSKQVLDIHEEAKRIAAEQKEAHPTATSPTTVTPAPATNPDVKVAAGGISIQ